MGSTNKEKKWWVQIKKELKIEDWKVGLSSIATMKERKNGLKFNLQYKKTNHQTWHKFTMIGRKIY